MRKVVEVLILAGLLACESAKEPSAVRVSEGRVVRLDSFPSEFVTKRNVDIWLPEDYSVQTKYRVLYMHDGQMLFDSTTTWNSQEWKVDEIASRLMDEGVRPFIVVGIWNSGRGRHSDYFPQKPFENLPQEFTDSLLREAKRNGEAFLFSNNIQSDNYLRFLAKELKPHIDKTFSTLTGPQDTFIAGSSMGGLISLYAMCEYPEVFGGAACLSTHWPGTFTMEGNPIPGAFRDYMRASLPDPASHKLYFDFGTATLDAFYEPFQVAADSVMVERGYSDSNWITRKFEGENHSEAAWSKRLDVPIVFLMGKN